MANPLELVVKLRENFNDLGAKDNNADQWWARYVAAEAAAAQERSRQREAEMRGRAREAFDLMDRVGGVGGTERTRLNNAGRPSGVVLTDSPSLTGDPGTHGGHHEQQFEAPASQHGG
jgi:hypothetical protein